MEFIEHLLKHYPLDIVNKLSESLHESDTHALLLNHHKMEDETLLSLFPHLEKHPFIEHAYYYDKNEYSLGKTIYHECGAFYLQDPSAMLVASFLKDKNPHYILDMCAAPGGKTIQTCLNYPDSMIIANDISYERANVLSQNIERFGFHNVIVTAMNPKNFPHRFNNLFDVIIIDAPCSGSGMFRKQSEMQDDWTYQKVLSCAERQKDLLALADDYLSNDGYLLYSTCSFSYEEDEEPIIEFLSSHPNYELLKLPQNPCFYEHPSLKGSIHLFPSLYKGEGQFIALIHKKGITNKKSPFIKKWPSFTSPLLKEFPLENLFLISRNNKIYGLPEPFSLDDLTIIRSGLEIGEMQKNYFIPSLALARFLSWERNIELTKEQCEKYLSGETLPLELDKKGYYTVSYLHLPIGFIKYSNGQGKNLYPKGLRKKLVIQY